MKLSEAIRLGGMATSQAIGRLWDDNGGTCAMGGAFQAIGVLDQMKALYREIKHLSGEEQRVENKKLIAATIAAEWIPLMGTPSTCPECGKRDPWLTVPHLNDRHRWTRSQIADWVETVENAQESKQETIAQEAAR